MFALIKNLFFIILFATSSVCQAEPTKGLTQIQIQQYLNKYIQDFNSAWVSSYPEETLVAQLLPMNVDAYQNFIAQQMAPEHAHTPGAAALQAFYEPNGFFHNQPTDICFLLYNPEKISELTTQFYTSKESDLSVSLFLVAHELAHCFDFKYKLTEKAGFTDTKSKLYNQSLESFADTFAYLILLNNQQLKTFETLYKLRMKYATNSTHDTKKSTDILITLLKNNSIQLNGSIKDLIFIADNIRKQALK